MDYCFKVKNYDVINIKQWFYKKTSRIFALFIHLWYNVTMNNETIQYNWQEVYIGFAKQPLMPTDKFGYLGVKIQNLEKTHIMCCECGKFFKRIHTKHLNKHWLSMLEYKKKYGYSLNTSIIADAESLAISRAILWKPHSIDKNKEALEKREIEHKKSLDEWKSKWENSMERKNKYWTCPEQIKDRLKNYIERYWQLPTYAWLWEDWKALYSLLKHKFGDINKWFKEYWLPTKKIKPWSYVEYTFSDGEKIKIGYNYDNWEKLVKKIKKTSLLFVK